MPEVRGNSVQVEYLIRVSLRNFYEGDESMSEPLRIDLVSDVV
jgi:hypothetical protein